MLLGFMQRWGIDYDEKYSPTVQWRVVRYLIAMWTCKDWEVAEKVDLKQAFNSTPIDIPFFVRQPPGHEMPGKESLVYRLKKSLPGGKQMSRNLHLALRKLLIEKASFRPILSDGCVYRWTDTHNTSIFIILVVWVDDCFFFGSTSETREKVNSVCELLSQNEYAVHRLGDITSSPVLGCRVQRNRTTRTSTIDVQEYIENFLKSTKDEQGKYYWDIVHNKTYTL